MQQKVYRLTKFEAERKENMTARKNKGKYEVCRDCGAHLDHGERCDCEERQAAAQQDAIYKVETAPTYKEETE